MTTSSLQLQTDRAYENLVVRNNLVSNKNLVSSHARFNTLDVGALDVESHVSDDLIVNTLTVTTETNLSGPTSVTGEVVVTSSNLRALSVTNGLGNTVIMDPVNAQVVVEGGLVNVGVLNANFLLFSTGGPGTITLGPSNNGTLGQTYNVNPVLPMYASLLAAQGDGLQSGDIFINDALGAGENGLSMVP